MAYISYDSSGGEKSSQPKIKVSAGLVPSRDSRGGSGPCLFQPLEAADLPQLLVTSLQPLLPPSGILPVHDNQASFLLLFFSQSSCLTLWEPTNVSFSISRSLLKLTSTVLVMPFNHLIPNFLAYQIMVFTFIPSLFSAFSLTPAMINFSPVP